MGSGIRNILSFLILVALIAIFPVVQAPAAQCGADSYPIWLKGKTGSNLVSSGSVLSFIGVSEYTYPPVGGIKYYKWSYSINPDPNTSSFQILVPAPNSCDIPNKYFCMSGDMVPVECSSQKLTSPPDPTLGTTQFYNPYFGFALWQYQTLQMTRDNSSGSYVFFTEKNSVPVPTSVVVKMGNGDGFAQTMGPSVPQSNLVAVSREQTLTLADTFFKLTREPINGCISGVSVCDSAFTNCSPLDLDSTIGGESVLNCASVSGTGGCQECSVVYTGSPTCVFISGYKSCSCKSTEYWMYDINDATAGGTYYSATIGKPNSTWGTRKVVDCSTTIPLSPYVPF